ncbi:MAG: AarF/ABC1/UbiB kinase family protein [Deltaproteobacteria bacterium]|nr:AarF/ABC1/UbiB kinase family protein [Deltaproteobacteria bacterium]
MGSAHLSSEPAKRADVASSPPDEPLPSPLPEPQPSAPPATKSVRPPSPAPIASRAPLGRPRHRPPVTFQLRFIKAYWTTVVVLWSYLRIGLMGRVLGREWKRLATEQAHALNARRIERTILELQGLFIKVGQMISIMTNFLPDDFRRPLEALQDQIPAHPFDEVKGRIEGELGRPLDQLFAHIEPQAIASASLGQVHEARMHDGRRVAVKVQHRDIDQIAKIDLSTIRRIIQLVSFFVPIQGLDVVYRQVREMVLAELDFEREADSIETIGASLAETADRVRTPTVIRERSSARVLTTSFEVGTKISDVAAIDKMGVDRKDVARRLIRAYCQMIFRDGFYHADPHPGNVLVQDDGNIVLLDFGAVATVSPAMREGIPRFLEAVIKRDTDGIVDALRSMGFIARAGSQDSVERIVEYFHQRFQQEVKIDSFSLKDMKIDVEQGIDSLIDFTKQDISLKELTSTFQVPKDWVLLERTVLLMTGVCTTLDPELNPTSVIWPYVQEFALGKDRDLATLFVNAVKESAMSALTVPEELRRYLGKAMRGGLSVSVPGISEGASLLYALGHQIIFSAVAITTMVMSFTLYLRADYIASVLALAASGFFVMLLFVSMWLARKHKKGR